MANIVELFKLCRKAAELTLQKAAEAHDTNEMKRLQEILNRIDQGPVRATIFGQTSSGKSTIINALSGEITVPEGAGITTAVPTYIIGDAKAVRRGNVRYYMVHFTSDDEEDLLPGVLCEVSMGRASFLTTKNHSPNNKDELERFMAKNSPHYRAVIGSEEMEEHYISIIDTPGIGAGDSKAENSDTKELLRELDNGFELLIYTVKTDSILEDDREIISQCLEMFKDNVYFDKHCLFAVKNKEREYDKEAMFGFVNGLKRSFGEYSDTKNRFYYFSAINARLKRAGIYNSAEYLPDGFTLGRGEDEERGVEEQNKLLKLIEDEWLEDFEPDFVRFKDDLFAQAKKIGDDPSFIIDTVGPLFDWISQSADKFRNSEIDLIDRQYDYDPDGKLPHFGEEKLKELSKKRTALWHIEKKLPEVDDSPDRLKDRIDELETIGQEAPGAIGQSAQEIISTIQRWQTVAETLRQPDLGNADLSQISDAIRGAKELIEEYQGMSQLYGDEISFKQSASDFEKSHSYGSNYNCSKEEIWYCKENVTQMDSWFLERIDTDTLPLIYDTIRQDYGKITETVINDLTNGLKDSLNKNDIPALRAKQYYIYVQYIHRVNSFIDTYVRDDRHQNFIPILISDRMSDVSVKNPQILSSKDFTDELAAFVNSKVPIIRQDKGVFKKMQAVWVRADFGRVCAKKIASFFDGEVQKVVSEYYQKLADTVQYVIRQDADDYIAAMAEPMNAVSNLLDDFEHMHNEISQFLREGLEANAKELVGKCSDAVKLLHENVENQKKEIMQQYFDEVNALKDDRYAEINGKYSDIDNALKQVSEELKELKKEM